MLRRAKLICDLDVQSSVQKQIREEFKINKSISDLASQKALLKEAQRHLAAIEALHGQQELPSDSWLHTKDEEDKRGRVGSGWPWQ